jgi:hypothetical protein
MRLIIQVALAELNNHSRMNPAECSESGSGRRQGDNSMIGAGLYTFRIAVCVVRSAGETD